jgi:dihydropyrimidinase
MEAYQTWRGWAEKSAADYGFHVAVTWWDEPCTADMGTLVQEEGVNSFKHFMAYKNAIMCDDETLVNSFKRALELGAMPTVHAENGELVFLLQQEWPRMGITGPGRPPAVAPAHGRGRGRQPRDRDRRRAGRADLCGACVLHRVGRGDRPRPCPRPARVRRGAGRPSGDRRLGLPQPRLRLCRRPCDEPAVPPKGNQEFLWRGLQSGNLHTTATDHCTFCAEQKAAADDFSKIPNGCGGVEERLAVIWDAGRQHRAPDAQRVRRHHLGQYRQAVQPLPAQGLRRRRRRCRPGGLGPARAARRCRPSTSTARATSTSSKACTVRGIPSHTAQPGQAGLCARAPARRAGAGRYIKRPPLARNFEAAQRARRDPQAPAVAVKR